MENIRNKQINFPYLSVRCRFTAFGFILGLLLGLAALIPIIITWQTSVSQTDSTTAASTSVSTASFLTASSYIYQCTNYFCDERVDFTTNSTSTALSLTITIQQTGTLTLQYAYCTSSSMTTNCTTSTNSIVCTFFIQSGQLTAGSYECAVQLQLVNENHTTSPDTYSATATNICGIVSSASGNFP
ncbi:unnamed protein product [Adineta steineri]|uniref:Uncharacterized protein n=1 Tax=Adineta steineri TaxID=433720 RepID=A0A814NNX0_9BILA|nr:unnamed protein product [Adineta steineri]CAF4209907.1 unnamed protein product [Adineta steineri]